MQASFLGNDAKQDVREKWNISISNEDYEISNDNWRSWVDRLSLISRHRYPNTGLAGSAYGIPQCITNPNIVMVNGEIASELKALAEPSTKKVRSLLGSMRSNIKMGTDPFSAIRDQYSSFLYVDTRLAFSQSTNGILDLDQIQNLSPAPRLAISKKEVASINKTLSAMFGKHIFIEQSQEYDYDIYLADAKTKPPKRYAMSPNNIIKIHEELAKWIRDNNATKLTDEGHGIKAAVKILYELEISLKQIIFIDEPELHLYPRSKYLLGKHISDFCRSNKKQIFVATHDTELLRGLVESKDNSHFQIIKVHPNRSLTQYRTRTVKSTIATDSLRASFTDAVIVVEGVVDKFVYGEILRRKHMLDSIDYAIVSEDGKSNIWKDHEYLNLLNIRIAYIMDFDSLLSNGKSPAAVTKLLDKLGNTKNRDAADVKNQISALNYAMKGIVDKRKELKSAAPNKTKALITDVLSELKKLGIFICPNGELEDWISKDKCASLTPEKIVSIYMNKSNSLYGAPTRFLEEIRDYLAPQTYNH